MYKFFNALVIIGLILTLIRIVVQIDAVPSFPGDYLFPKYSIPSIMILLIGVIGTSVLKTKAKEKQ